MAVTGPRIPPVELNMSSKGGLIAELRSEAMSNLDAVKRVELPSKLK